MKLVIVAEIKRNGFVVFERDMMRLREAAAKRKATEREQVSKFHLSTGLRNLSPSGNYSSLRSRGTPTAHVYWPKMPKKP